MRVAEVDQEAPEAPEAQGAPEAPESPEAPAPARTPSCERLSTILTTDYQLWPHGFAVTATLYHSRAALQMLQQSPRLSLSELCALAGAHPGHLAAMLGKCERLGGAVHGRVWRRGRAGQRFGAGCTVGRGKLAPTTATSAPCQVAEDAPI